MRIPEEIKKGLACDSVGRPDSVIGRTVCVVAHPGKMAIFPFVRWFEKRYLGRYRFARLTFSFDLFLIGLVLGLALTGLVFFLWKPTDFSDKIYFDATVAPREVVSGAPSTLIIRYTNGTGEELRNAELSLGFPAHFELQEIAGEVPISENTASLGTIPVGGSGSIRVRGVMFGDVGGKQTFRSLLTFTHGEKNIGEQKISFHTFSPARSTLALAALLPSRLVAFQQVEGTITYHNTGEIDFPEITIEPKWPTGFRLTKSSVPLRNGTWRLPGVTAGKSGTLTFEGILGDSGADVTFVFSPSFTFGETRYRQEDLAYTREIVPPPLKVSHSIDGETLRPGGTVTATIAYENVGAWPLKNVAIGFESDSPFFRSRQFTVDARREQALAEIAPGARGTVTVSAPLRSSILQSETTEYENIKIRTYAIGTYRLPDPDTGSLADAPSVTSRGSEIAATLVSPFVLESFARYTAPSGDQLGRGPLPPVVGLETKYWVFWNIRGTTNRLENVKIEGDLGPGVRFTGRQTVSQNEGVTFDPGSGTLKWNAAAIEPTLSPESRIVGIAFEVGITPTADQVGKIPVLLTHVNATGTDAVTGAFVSASGANVTTNLPNDARAAGKAAVVP
jgi:hypothetical protein